MPLLPVRRRRRSRVLGCALAAASACLAVPLSSAVALADASTLTTDAGGSALVNAAQLSPGHVLERCVVVTTPTAYAAADLGMFVTTAGALADHLNVTVESGTGGSFADCTGFTGRLVFVGTLGALAASYDATRPERVGHFSASVSSATLRLRFSVQDDNAAQGLTTTASFWWLPVAAAVVTPPTSDPPGPSATPPTTPAGVPPPATPTARPVRPPTGVPTPTGPPAPMTGQPSPSHSTSLGLPRPEQTTSSPTPAPVATSLGPPVGVPLTQGDGSHSPAAGPPAAGGDQPPSSIVGQLASGLATGVANAAQTISTAAAPALKGAAVTSLMILPLLLLFLLVQRWFDRRDPKLVLAPSYGDAFLGFADRHRLAPPDRQGEPS